MVNSKKIENPDITLDDKNKIIIKIKSFFKSKWGTLLLLILTWFGIFYFLILGKYTDHYFGEAFLCTNLEWFSIVCLVFVGILFFLIILWLINTWKNNDFHKRRAILITYGAIYVSTFILLSLQVLLAITFANTLFANEIDPNADFANFIPTVINNGIKEGLDYILILDNLNIFNNLFSSLWIISIIISLFIGSLFYFQKLKIKNELKYKYTVNTTLILAFISMTFSFQGLQGLGTFGLNTANVEFIDINQLQNNVNNALAPISINFIDTLAPKNKWLGANNNIPSYLLLALWVFIFILACSYWIYNVYYKDLSNEVKINKRTNFIFNLFVALIIINLIFFYSLDKFIIYPITRNQIEQNGGAVHIEQNGLLSYSVVIDNIGINPGLYNNGISILLSNGYKTNSYYISMFILNPMFILFTWIYFRIYFYKK